MIVIKASQETQSIMCYCLFACSTDDMNVATNLWTIKNIDQMNNECCQKGAINIQRLFR